MYTNTLATLFMLVVLGTGVFTVQLPLQPSVLYASSNESDQSSDSENDEQATESNDDGDSSDSNNNDGGSTDEPQTPTTSTPEPEPTTPTAEPTVDDQLAKPAVEQPAATTTTECQEGYILKNDKCVPDPLTELGNLVGPPPECPPEAGLTPLECLDKVVNPPVATEDLPPCDGSAQDCISRNGDVCLVGQGGEACECLPDMSDCPKHPSLLEPPVEEPTCPPGQFPVTPGDPSSCVDCEGPCPEEPPANPGPDGDCLFDPSLPKCASDNGVCPEGFFQNEDGNCVPRHPNGCPEGFHSHEDDETGQCIPDSVPCEPGFIIRPDFPTCERQDRVCEEFPDLDACKNGDDNNDNNNDNGDDVDVTIINKVVNIVKDVNKRGHNNFPQIDIIGLSTKQNGDSMVCLINIDNENVQCQDFGMPSDRVKGDFWRVIETDQDKNYDNGNTGSNDIDGVIDDLKNQDFSELDDATNHDFGIDLAWIAINPSGDGVACLAEDSTGKGKSLCEPFKVNSEEIDGQITEGVAIKS